MDYYDATLKVVCNCGYVFDEFEIEFDIVKDKLNQIPVSANANVCPKCGKIINSIHKYDKDENRVIYR